MKWDDLGCLVEEMAWDGESQRFKDRKVLKNQDGPHCLSKAGGRIAGAGRSADSGGGDLVCIMSRGC
jgi:hypothetical protein